MFTTQLIKFTCMTHPLALTHSLAQSLTLSRERLCSLFHTLVLLRVSEQTGHPHSLFPLFQLVCGLGDGLEYGLF